MADFPDPLYVFVELFSSLREGARRLGLVSIAQMTAAMVDAIEHPPAAGDSRLIEVPQIKAAAST
jgi:hypothetical protein